jgi:hypothetical protein
MFLGVVANGRGVDGTAAGKAEDAMAAHVKVTGKKTPIAEVGFTPHGATVARVSTHMNASGVCLHVALCGVHATIAI